MRKPKALFIGGSLNQTTIVHSVARHLPDWECWFTPFYCDGGLLRLMAEANLLGFSVIGGQARLATEAYLAENSLLVDYGGERNDYDLVVTTSDLIIQNNIRQKPIVLIQEGMTDPENWAYHLVKWLGLPRYLASTSTNGLSQAYRAFCVASEGYRDLFTSKGADPARIVVTGIPNFDNAAQYLHNDFSHHRYVLVATSDARETFKFDNRRQFIQKALIIANGRPLIFKLHPNENVARATREINELAPQALVFATGNTNHMIANCDVLITQYSSVVYVGIALGKECYSYFDMATLRRLLPIQNGGTSGQNIAAVCRQVLDESRPARRPIAQDARSWPRSDIRLGG